MAMYPRNLRSNHPCNPRPGMTLIVKTITRVVAGFIATYGIYLVLYGHLTPGGGFAGGVILACGFVLLVLAFGKDFTFRILSQRGTSIWDCLGAFAFLAIALLGYIGGTFFFNVIGKGRPFHLLSAGTIPLANIAIGIKVAACLCGVFIALVLFRMMGGSEETEEE